MDWRAGTVVALRSVRGGVGRSDRRVRMALGLRIVSCVNSVSQVRTFHDGVLVPLCFGTSGVADPDPCVLEKIFLPDGDLQVTVLSSQNGKWRN